MENAIKTVKEHACASEEAAMECHRLRMERAKQEIGLAIEDAVDQINKATAKQCADQKENIQTFYDQHSADTIKMLDNFTGEAERIRLEVFGRIQDGVIEDQGGILIEEEDPPQPAVSEEPSTPQERPEQHIHNHPRWGNIDMLILSNPRRDNRCKTRPPFRHGIPT